MSSLGKSWQILVLMIIKFPLQRKYYQILQQEMTKLLFIAMRRSVLEPSRETISCRKQWFHETLKQEFDQ